MIVKLAASKIDKSENNTCRISWRRNNENIDKADNLLPALAKIVDNILNKKEFTIVVDGKSHTINPANYYFYDKEMRHETTRTLNEDYGVKESSSNSEDKSVG